MYTGGKSGLARLVVEKRWRSMTPRRRTQRLAKRTTQRSGQHSHPLTACHACARTAASSLHSSKRRDAREQSTQRHQPPSWVVLDRPALLFVRAAGSHRLNPQVEAAWDESQQHTVGYTIRFLDHDVLIAL